jgi:hypothetical protein
LKSGKILAPKVLKGQGKLGHQINGGVLLKKGWVIALP